MIEELSRAVVERLRAEIPEVTVEEFPDDPTRSRQAFAPKHALLLVGYERSTWGTPESFAPRSQVRELELSVTLLVRALRGPRGAQTLIDRVVGALMGWRPSGEGVHPRIRGGQPFHIVRDELVAHESGVWRFAVTFRTSRPFVSTVGLDDLSGPPLASVELTPGENA